MPTNTRVYSKTITSVPNAGQEYPMGYENETGRVVGVFITSTGVATQMDAVQIRHETGESGSTLVYGSSGDTLPLRDGGFEAYFDARAFGQELFLYLQPDATDDLNVTVMVEL